jgi:hypothetical protein
MRETKTALEIQIELTRLISDALASQDVPHAIQVGLAVPRRDPDLAGCNWYVEYFKNAQAHMPVVGTALRDVKARWNLDVTRQKT